MAPRFPHLTETESVRQEAADQYGGLSDAAAFREAHFANRDPSVDAASLRQRNGDETATVQNDLDTVQGKIDEAYGEGYSVIDAAVRGDALSVVATDPSGRPVHLVTGHTDRWKPIQPKGAQAEARANAQAEAARGRLGAEARAEVKRLVEEATAEVLARVGKLFGERNEEVIRVRDEAVSDVIDEETTSQEHRARVNAGFGGPPGSGSGDRGAGAGNLPDDEGAAPEAPKGSTKSGGSGGSPSTTEGNDTSESSAGATAGTETSTGDTGSGSGDGGSDDDWPRRHADLDAIAADEGVEFASDDKLDDKIAKLRAAGASPPRE